MITTDTLVKKVRALVNEAESDSDVSLITDDMRSLDNVIVELLPQAVSLMQKNSMGGYVNVKALPEAERTPVFSSDGHCSIPLPYDFARLVSLQLSSWGRPCTHISSSESSGAVNFLNGSSTVGRSRPLCIGGVSALGNKVVELFPAGNGDTLLHFVYEAQFNTADGLNKCDVHMADAVAYACTALLYNVFERCDAAKSFMSYAMALCGGK